MINLSTQNNILNYKMCIINTTNAASNIIMSYNKNITYNNTSNINYIAKRDFLFRFVQPAIRMQLKMDDESLYSTTDQLTADRISKDILKFIPSTSTITDATACIGGTAYSFAQHFDKVNAIEIDSVRYRLMLNNLNILLKEIQKNNVICINNDALIACKHLKQDAVFIDPPWGGPDYKQNSKLSLYLSNMELSVVCKNLHTYTKYIVIKVPTNFDELTFINNTELYMELVNKNTTLRKMYLLIFKCKKNI